MSRNAPQLPNNFGTDNAVTVYTSTGFNAGDPVYFQNGDYKSAANLTAPSSVNFNFTENAAIKPDGVGGTVAPSFTYTQMQSGISGGTNRKFAAVLTNGNIVQAFSNYAVAPVNPSCVYFRIVNSSGTVVVSPTVVSTVYTQTSYSAVSVAALTGGGFVIGWINNVGGTTNSFNYAIYNNTGSVVTSATQDTGFAPGGSYVPLEMTSLANGGFAVAIKYTTGSIYLRAYNATGVAAYAVQSVGISGSGVSNSFGIASRSDSSVFIIDNVSATVNSYVLYNSSGAAIVSATSITVNSTNSPASPDVTVLSDGTTIVIAYYNTNGSGYSYPAMRLLPTGNVLGAETAGVPAANFVYQTTYAGQVINVLAITGNNIALFFSDGYGNMQYAFYNSSLACISGSNTAGTIPYQITGGFCGPYSRMTLLESSGYVYAYWSPVTTSQKPVQQVYCKISTSNYIAQPFSSVSGSTYSITGQPTGALIPSTVTPSSASYYTTTSSNTIVTNTASTVVNTTVLSSTPCDAIANCQLTSGRFVVAWKATSGYAITANVCSQNGSVLSTISVGTGTSNIYSVKVAALSGGGFVIAYVSSGSTITLAVYSSAYTLSTTSTVSFGSYGTAYNHALAGLQDNKFVMLYNNPSGQAQISVFNSSCTLLQSFIQGSTINQGMAIAANPWGGFGASGFGTGYAYYWAFTYVPTGTDTWAQAAATTHSNATAFCQNPQLCATQSGSYIMTAYGGGYPQYNMFTDAGAVSVPYTAQLSSWPLGAGNNPTSYPMMGIGLTGNGNVVIATSYSSTSLGIACLPAQMTFSPGQPLPYNVTGGSSNVPMFSKNAYTLNTVAGVASYIQVGPSFGNYALLTFTNGSNYPSFMIVNGTNNTNSYSVVANTTPSFPAAIAPTPAISSNINGVLAGVAATTASAGSTGKLITNGQVQLGSSYTSTTTGAFDYTGNAVPGVKGTYNGKNINLQGNS